MSGTQKAYQGFAPLYRRKCDRSFKKSETFDCRNLACVLRLWLMSNSPNEVEVLNDVRAQLERNCAIVRLDAASRAVFLTILQNSSGDLVDRIKESFERQAGEIVILEPPDGKALIQEIPEKTYREIELDRHSEEDILKIMAEQLAAGNTLTLSLWDISTIAPVFEANAAHPDQEWMNGLACLLRSKINALTPGEITIDLPQETADLLRPELKEYM